MIKTPSRPPESWIDPDTFNAGSLMHGLAPPPRRGDKPQRRTRDDWREHGDVPAIDLEDEAFRCA